MQLVLEADAAGDATSLQQRIDEALAAGVPAWQLEVSSQHLEGVELDKRIEAVLRGHPVEEAVLARCCDEAEAMGRRSGAVRQAQEWLRDRRQHQRERLEVESAVRAVLRYAEPETSPEPPAIGSRPSTPAAKGKPASARGSVALAPELILTVAIAVVAGSEPGAVPRLERETPLSRRGSVDGKKAVGHVPWYEGKPQAVPALEGLGGAPAHLTPRATPRSPEGTPRQAPERRPTDAQALSKVSLRPAYGWRLHSVD